MKNLICFVLSTAALSMLPVRSDVRHDADRLLKTWCDALICHQLEFPADGALDGGMVCPACGFLHGRICDSVYAFAVEWKRTGESKYLRAAERAVDWTERNMLRPEGFYKNDAQSTWFYTTVFSQIAFYKTLSRFSGCIPEATRRKWHGIYVRQSEWLHSYFLRPDANPVVNYWGNFSEAMAEAGLYLREPKYTRVARDTLEKLLCVAFTQEGLLKGEGPPLYDPSSVRGNFRVDFGYNLEETLPALLNAAEILGDAAAEERILKSALLQLEVLLPDGAIDNSFGARSSKWTYSGSRTSDGVLPLLAKLERRQVGWARRAAERVVALHGRLTGTDGLLAGGLHYADAGEPACIHHTFTHVKALAEWLELTEGVDPPIENVLMPREQAPKCIEFPSMSSVLVGVGPWRASFSASDAYVQSGPADVRRLSVGGGSPTLLWHEKVGPVLAATQYDFFYVEPPNQQDQRHDTDVLTTNSRLVSADGRFCNVCDVGARVKGEMKDGVFRYRADGHLTSVEGEVSSAFEIEYALDAEKYFARVKSPAGGRYYFPIVAGRDVAVEREGNRAVIKYPQQWIEIKSSKP
ncbi:MAG: hypothetical protein IJG13_05470, partial [Kiritimatiellae bacterium]|nr:hypothetical protein [Kiritimatiellia bacterium]